MRSMTRGYSYEYQFGKGSVQFIKTVFLNPCQVGPCHYSMAHPQVADRAFDLDGFFG